MNADGTGVRKIDWALPEVADAGRAALAVALAVLAAVAAARAATRPAGRSRRATQPAEPVGKPVALTLLAVDPEWARSSPQPQLRGSRAARSGSRSAVGGSAIVDYERRLVEKVRAGEADLVSVGRAPGTEWA